MEQGKRRVLSVIIPCYNEAHTIESVVQKVLASHVSPFQVEIIVVDDGSREETLEALARLPSDVRVILRSKNGGKGAAVKEGLAQASGEYCLIQDADLELDPSEYHLLLSPIAAGNADATFGYRVLRRNTPNAPLLFLGGKALTTLYNILFGTALKDIPCCYKIFPRSCIPNLLLTPSNDFVFDAVEMTRVITRTCHVVQVPITYTPRSRAAGKKLFLRHGFYCAIAIVLLRLGLHRHPIDEELPRFLRYLISGVVTVSINIAVLYALVEWIHFWYLTASVTAFCVSYVANFSLHKFWTFKKPEFSRLSSELPRHFALAICNIALNTLIMYVLVEQVGTPYLLAQLIASGVIALESFLILSRFIFPRIAPTLAS